MAADAAGAAPVTVRALTRAEAEASFDALARLRITVFRDYPYLYDGDAAYERDYLAAQVARFGGNISRTAEFVGMERSALHRKLKMLGLYDRKRKNGTEEGSQA